MRVTTLSLRILENGLNETEGGLSGGTVSVGL